MVVFATTHPSTEAKAHPPRGERKEQWGIQCPLPPWEEVHETTRFSSRRLNDFPRTKSQFVGHDGDFVHPASVDTPKSVFERLTISSAATETGTLRSNELVR